MPRTTPELATQLGHAAVIMAASFCPDGRLLASVGRDQTMKLWDVASGRQIRTFTGTPGDQTDDPTLAWRPDGQWIAVTGGPDGVRVWEVATGRTIRVEPDHRAAAVVFTADGRLALAEGNTIILWDVESDQVVHTLSGHAGEIRGLAASGNLLLSGGVDQHLILWDTASGARVRDFDALPGETASVAIGADGKLALSGDQIFSRVSGPKPLVRLWDVTTGKQIRTFEGHTASIDAVALSADGKLALSSGDYDALITWDVTTGKQARVIQKDAAIGTSGLDPDGKRAFSIEAGVALWDVVTGAPIRTLSGRVGRVGAVCFGQGGERALVGYEDGTASLWDVATLQPIRTFEGHTGEVQHVALSRDGLLAVTGGHDTKAIFWDTTTGRKLHEIDGFGSIHTLAVSPDGRTALIGRRSDSVVAMTLPDEALTLCDTATGAQIRAFREPGRPAINSTMAVAFSDDGRLVFSGHTLNVRRWDAATGALESASPSLQQRHESVNAQAFDTARGRVLTGGNDDVVRLWDATTGALIHALHGHTESVLAVAISPDGARGLSGSESGAVILWDLAAGAQIRALPGHVGRIMSIAFHPDGKHALTGSWDGTARLWNAETGQSVNLIARKAEWLIYTDDSYFDASPSGAALVAMVEGTTSYAIDQLAVKNNRPDLLLSRVDLGPPDLLAHFRAQHARRLSRLQLTEEQLGDTTTLPDARILQAEASEGGRIDIEIELADAEGLSHYQIYANDVPLFAGQGKPIYGKEARFTETVDLAPGPNRIEVSAVNTRGRESLRALTTAEGDDETPPDLYFLGFGVSRYADPDLDLGYADKDARDLADVLGRAPGFGRVHIRTLTNEEVTVGTIREAKSFLEGSRPRDTFVLFIAGHGTHDRDAAAAYYFLTHEANPDDLAGTAASFELIEDLLVGIPPRNKLFLMDTCESGERDAPSQATVLAEARERGLTPRIARNVRPNNGPAPIDPLKNHPWLRQRARFVYLDLSRRSGAIVFSSSRGGEFSYESAETQNGYFTREILTALTSKTGDGDSDGWITTDELRTYVTQAVAERSHGLQNPTVDRDNLVQKFGFPIVDASARAPATDPSPDPTARAS
ncbi:MAG: caspase family protein [Minicystis sp.]